MTDLRRLALVTGASSGIGLALANEFARRGFDLLVAAEDPAILTAAVDLRRSGVRVEAVQVDLSEPAGVQSLVARVAAAGRPLDAAALNAGIGTHGAFATETDLQTELRVVDVNVRSTIHLAKRLLEPMVARGQGRILFTTSVSATHPGPFQAVYAASKSFVQSFALALRAELDGTGVVVATLMPGPTDTPFFGRSGIPGSHLDKHDPAAVARAGVDGLVRGDRIVVISAPSRPAIERLGRRATREVRAALRGRRAKHRAPSPPPPPVRERGSK